MFCITIRYITQVSSTMKDHKSLADMDDDRVNVGKALDDFSIQRLECIKRFSDCHSIVQWIKKTTTG